ncbi:unnamed protein product [Ceutorhynchus assimilis]|uniref:Uncharacterized protein n=1 Tax=Ceutorhynchus assimilis TaxID=467358 RepID=A0A9N9MAJ1_9CUCU|nr:unnamed protein product [Ceutorhynchus assimilis]
MKIQNLTKRISKNEEIISQSIQENSDWLPPQTRLTAKALALLLSFSALMLSIPFVVFFGKPVAREKQTYTQKQLN